MSCCLLDGSADGIWSPDIAEAVAKRGRMPGTLATSSMEVFALVFQRISSSCTLPLLDAVHLSCDVALRAKD